MLLIGTKNFATQDVIADGIINIGSVYRRYCKKNACGIATFSRTSQDITLNQSGIYHVTATLVGSGDAAGDVTVQLFINGEAVDGAFSTQTITTADTELRTFVIDYYILVDKDCILGSEATVANSISLVNTGVAATFTSVIVNVSKEV